MAANGPALIIVLSISCAIFLSIVIAILSSQARSGIVKLGLLSSLRRPMEILYPALPVALVGAVILSSLGTGDGLEEMVRENVESNMSGVGMIVEFPDPIVLTRQTWEALEEEGIAPALILSGTGYGDHSSKPITVIGADDTIFQLLPVSGAKDGPSMPDGGAYINQKASAEFEVSRGGVIEVLLPDHESRNLLMKGPFQRIVFAVSVDSVIDDSGIGRFRPDARGSIDPIVIVDIEHISSLLEPKNGINRLLCPLNMDEDRVTDILKEYLVPADLGFEITDFQNISLVRNKDFMFRDPGGIGDPSLAYFVDSIASGGRSISYSTVLAAPEGIGTWPTPEQGSIVISNHTAERLRIGVGGKVRLSYRHVDSDGGLSVGSTDLTVERILVIYEMFPLQGLVPPIEGITESQSCSDWSPSFGVDLDNVTSEDIAYWNAYRTTPKLLMNLTDARNAFGSVYGDTTGILGNASEYNMRGVFSERIGIEYVGGRIIDSRNIALESDRGMRIFPMMFLTFGTTVIIAASLTLWGTLKGRAARRSREWGISRTIGLGRRGLFIASVLDAIPSAVLGIVISVPLGYALASLLGGPLGPGWSGTDQSVGMTVVPATVLFSASLTFIITLSIIAALSAREVFRRTSAQIRSEAELPMTSKAWAVPTISIAAAVLGLALILLSATREGNSFASALFVLGTAMGSAGIAVLGLWAITGVRDRSAERLLVTANLRRRHTLTPIVVSVLALTIGIAVALSAIGSGLEGDVERTAADYGGGFDHYAELTTPNKEGIDRSSMLLHDKGYTVRSLLSVGDEGGSCTNINAPFPPRLIGCGDDVRFRISRWSGPYGSSDEAWSALNSTIDGRIPILVDENTLIWIYSGDVGSTYTLTAEDGRMMNLVVIGILSPSVLSGTFVMAEHHLKDNYPRSAKESILLIRSPGSGGSEDEIRSALSELAPDIRSIREMARENLDYELGYLHLFRGFIMTGIVTGIASAVSFTAARTAERSADHSLLRSVGTTRRTIRRALFAENASIFISASAGALLVGTIAGLIAIPVGDPDVLSVLRGSILIPASVAFFGLASSVIGAYLSTREETLRRRIE
jgi:hypothetical protein